MKRLFSPSMLVLAVMFASPVAAQDPQASSQAAEAREPQALAALNRMGSALRKQMAFTINADLTAEDVLVDGQKLQYQGTLEIAARRPTNLRMIMKMGPSERQLYYDGKSLTLYSPERKAFATAAAPATIRETLAAAEDEYGLFIPLTDLFLWGEDPSIAALVTSAFYVATDKIGGESCEHYALRQPLVDWQVWIREGEDALPCKLVITSTSDPAMPQVAAVYHWQPGNAPAADAFTFRPPQGVAKIQFEPLKVAASSSTGK